jgi:hypothetical protein
MKRIIVIIIFFCFLGIFHSFAQDTKDNSIKAPTKMSSGGGDRLVLDFFDDIWQSTPLGIKVNSYSPGFNAFGMGNIHFGKSNFGLGLGIGFSTHNLRSNAIPVDSANGNYTYFDKIPTSVLNLSAGSYYSVKIDNNKLSLTYAEIPLEFRFRHLTQKKKAIKFSIGGKVGYLISDHTKYKGTDYYFSIPTDPNIGTTIVKYKMYHISNLNPLEYAATVRIGYGMFNIFASYTFSKTFKDKKGPQMYPVSVGISITPF